MILEEFPATIKTTMAIGHTQFTEILVSFQPSFEFTFSLLVYLYFISFLNNNFLLLEVVHFILIFLLVSIYKYISFRAGEWV
jgi:hypothetical protein